MARRPYTLPGIQDLSKEQEAIRALPKEGQHLIVGGPGTGKSVLALIRAQRHQRDGDDYRFLVFNHLLERANKQLFEGELASRTWMRWFHETFPQITRQPVPTLQPDDNDFKPIDWPGVGEIVASTPRREDWQPPYLVIDEGQDMPREFYRALVGLGFDRFFVVADQNQRITAANSSRRDLQDCLAIATEDVIELQHNYRNRYGVARLAGTFRTGDPASPPPELPPPTTGAAVPLLYTYDPADLDAVARGILRLADRDPRQLIGVIAPNNAVRARYLDALRTAEVELDHAPPRIDTFHAENRADVSFNEGGILVINVQASKGLEFDAAVLADIDRHYFRRSDPDAASRRFYVMTARARERVFMFMQQGGSADIERILPKDPKTLRRKTLES